jgi:hypothetical protein
LAPSEQQTDFPKAVDVAIRSLIYVTRQKKKFDLRCHWSESTQYKSISDGPAPVPSILGGAAHTDNPYKKIPKIF